MKTVLACILSLGLLLAGCEQPVAFKSTDISGVDWGKDFSLTDHQGKPAAWQTTRARLSFCSSATPKARMCARRH